MNRMETIALDVKQQVLIYFQDNLPRYTVLDIRRQSNHRKNSTFTWCQLKKTTARIRFGPAGTRVLKVCATDTMIC